MNGPHINWKIFDMLQKKVLGDVNKSLLNIGSCGLHVMHYAFPDECKASDWHIEYALSSLYWLFKHCPSRREDYTKVTGSKTIMLKFCQQCWIENITVFNFALLMWLHVQTYVVMVARKDYPEPMQVVSRSKEKCI